MASRRGIRAGAAFVELYADNNKLSRGLKIAAAKFEAFGRSITAGGKKMLAFGAVIAGPLALAVKSAASLQETMNKFNVVFGTNARAVKAWGDAYAAEVGRSREQVSSFMAEAQDLLVPIGFEAGAATDMSKQLTQLAVDLASFNNKADADVMRDLKAAMTGSGEVMKKYGVIVSEAAVKQQLLNRGIDPKVATDQQKVMARMAIIMAGTTAAQGDAIRSAGSFTNQMKALGASVADAGAEVGAALLPVLTPLVSRFVGIVKTAATWIGANKALVVQIAKIAGVAVAGGAALVALGAVLSSVGTVLAAASAAVGALGAALGFLAAHPIVATLTAIVGVAGALAAAMGILGGHTARLSDEMENLRKKGDETRATDKLRMERLRQLAAVEDKNARQTKEAAGLIQTLTDRYGDLGLSIDSTTGKIEGMAAAQKKFNLAMREAAIADVTGNLAELEANYAELQKEMSESSGLSFGGAEGMDKYNRIMSGRMRAIVARMVAAKKRLAALTAGDDSAATGGAKGDAEKLRQAIAAGNASGGGGMLAARQDAAAAQKRLAELDEQAAAKRRTALQQEIVDIRAVTAERLKLIDALIEGEKAREGGARAGVLSGLRRRRAAEGAAGEDRASEAMAAAARAADKAVADRAAEAAAIRLDAEKSLQSEIARLEIAATMKGHDKKMALLALEEKAALAAAAAEGVDEALIRRKYEMLRRLADAGRGAEAAAPKLSTTGMFDASHVGQMSGGSMAQRQAKAAERAAAGIERLLEKADAGELVLQFV